MLARITLLGLLALAACAQAGFTPTTGQQRFNNDNGAQLPASTLRSLG